MTYESLVSYIQSHWDWAYGGLVHHPEWGKITCAGSMITCPNCGKKATIQIRCFKTSYRNSSPVLLDNLWIDLKCLNFGTTANLCFNKYIVLGRDIWESRQSVEGQGSEAAGILKLLSTPQELANRIWDGKPLGHVCKLDGHEYQAIAQREICIYCGEWK